MGPWEPSARSLFKELSKRLTEVTGDQKAGSYLGQRISLAIQRANAASPLGTIPDGGAGARTMQSMSTLATAFLGFLPVPYPLGDNAVTCNFLQNSFCPVLEGEVLIYKLNMFIESFMPVGTSASVEFRIVDQNSSPVMCIRVPIQIVPPVNSRSNSTATLQGKL
ncbi:hypothetical protein evm_015091 [Chilo suppressalis]|nr:hypothetical protein evm_015091 [Chilo suppressalis]